MIILVVFGLLHNIGIRIFHVHNGLNPEEFWEMGELWFYGYMNFGSLLYTRQLTRDGLNQEFWKLA